MSIFKVIFFFSSLINRFLLFLLLFGLGLLDPSPVLVEHIKMLSMMLEGHGSTKTNWSTSSCSFTERVIFLQIMHITSVVKWKRGNSLRNNFDIFWYWTGIKHLLTIMKILEFFRLLTALWTQVGIWQYWLKSQPWVSQGWLFLLTQTMLVTKFFGNILLIKKKKYWVMFFVVRFD